MNGCCHNASQTSHCTCREAQDCNSILGSRAFPPIDHALVKSERLFKDTWQVLYCDIVFAESWSTPSFIEEPFWTQHNLPLFILIRPTFSVLLIDALNRSLNIFCICTILRKNGWTWESKFPQWGKKGWGTDWVSSTIMSVASGEYNGNKWV